MLTVSSFHLVRIGCKTHLDDVLKFADGRGVIPAFESSVARLQKTGGGRGCGRDRDRGGRPLHPRRLFRAGGSKGRVPRRPRRTGDDRGSSHTGGGGGEERAWRARRSCSWFSGSNPAPQSIRSNLGHQTFGNYYYWLEATMTLSTTTVYANANILMKF